MVEDQAIRPWRALGSFVVQKSQIALHYSAWSEPERCRVPFDGVRDSETLSLALWEI